MKSVVRISMVMVLMIGCSIMIINNVTALPQICECSRIQCGGHYCSGQCLDLNDDCNFIIPEPCTSCSEVQMICDGIFGQYTWWCN